MSDHSRHLGIFIALVGTGIAPMFAACGSPFSTCEARKTCEIEGDAGAGGADDPVQHGGSSGTSGGEAARGGDGPSAGTSGGPTAGGGAFGGEQTSGGRGGTTDPGSEAAGAGGTDSEEQPGGLGGSGGNTNQVDGPCDQNGALTCQGAAQKVSLICRQGRWQPNETCSSDENCDQDTGACAPIAEECVGQEPGSSYCAEDTLLECDADLVTADTTECEGRCAQEGATAECVGAACGDGKVQEGERCDDGNETSGDGCSAKCEVEIVGLALGDGHTCALGGNGAVKCWGLNSSGQLGQGDTERRDPGLGATLRAVDLGTGRHARAIASHGIRTCAILDNGTVKCWGSSTYGLGLGNLEPMGDQAGEMGDDLLPIDLGSGRTAKSISIGHSHTCVLLDIGRIKCWGSNSSGQLGVGDNFTRGAEPGQMGDQLRTVDLGAARYATAVAVGNSHTCALLESKDVACWGAVSAVGLGSAENPVGDDASEMGLRVPLLSRASDRTPRGLGIGSNATCLLLNDGSMPCWLYGQSQPQLWPGASDVVQVEFANSNTCVLTKTGSVLCWRDDAVSSLGVHIGGAPYGDTRPPTPVNLGRPARLIQLGWMHACAVLDDNSLKCWGNNNDGKLGYGDMTYDAESVRNAPPVSVNF